MFLNIYLKELKDSLRDRRTITLSVMLPILLLSGLILFYENILSDNKGETYTVAVSKEMSSEEKKLFEQESSLKLKAFSDPIEAVQEGKALAAIELGTDFLNNISNGQTTEVSIYGDSFSQNASITMAKLEATITSFKETVVQSRLQEKGVDPIIIYPLQMEVKEINDEGDRAQSINMLSGIMPMIIVLAIAAGSYPVAADLFAGEKDKKTMEALLMTPVSRTQLLFAKWLTISTLGVLAGIVSVTGIILETIFLTDKLKEALYFGEQTWSIILLSLLLAVLFSLFMASIMMLASILATTVKESQNYQSPILMLAILPMYAIGGMGLNELSTKHFVIPVMNLHALMKELLSGVIDIQNVLLTVASTSVSLVIVFIIARSLFLKDRWVLNK